MEEFENLWKEIVETNGKVDLDKVKSELHDVGILISNVSKVYNHVTKGRISKPLTSADSIIREYDNIRDREIEEAILTKNKSDLEAKELNKWKKVSSEINLKRFTGDDEVVSKQELMEIWGKSSKTIQRYVKDGMPVHEASSKTFQIFKIKEVTAWRDGSIDKTMSIRTQTPSEKEVDINDDGGGNTQTNDMLRKLAADADDAELKVKLNKLKLAEAEGRVVDANDLDRAMSELAVVHRTDKIHDENLLPILLENKDAGEIKTLLQEHNFERLKMLDEIVNKEFTSEETLYDMVEVILQELKQGTEPESLIKRINGSLI